MKTYTFHDIVDALNRMVSYHWAEFLHHRLDSTSAQAPVCGLIRGGWKLVFTSRPTTNQGSSSAPDDEYSIGLSVRSNGTVADSIYDGPAFRAGVNPGMKIAGVNGRVFTMEVLNEAIKATAHGAKTID